MRNVGFIGVAVLVLAIFIAIAERTSQGNVDWYGDSTHIAQRSGGNFIAGAGVTITRADDPTNSRVGLTFAATGATTTSGYFNQAGDLLTSLASSSSTISFATTTAVGDMLVVNDTRIAFDTSTAGIAIDMTDTTIDFDSTEVAGTTWGSGSGYTWTFDAGATDPTFVFTSDQIDINAATVDINGNRFDIDSDNDTSVRASADDVLTWEIGGSDLFTWRRGGTSGDVQTINSGNLVSGTATNIRLVNGTVITWKTAGANSGRLGVHEMNTQLRNINTGNWTATANPGGIFGAKYTVAIIDGNTNAFTVSQATGITTVLDMGSNASSTVTDWKGEWIQNAINVSASLTTQTGLYIENLTSGDTDYGIHVVGADTYAIFSDAGLNRFDGDGSHIFELPADATGNATAATGRIPVTIGGATKYLRYYDD